MSEGMVKSAPAQSPQTSAPQSPLPQLANTGHVIPDEVYAYFGIDNYTERMDTRLKSKLNNILAYAYETKQSADLGDLLSAISEIELKVGQPHFATSRFEQVHNFITIQRQINSLEKQKEAMFNGIRTSKTKRS